MLNSIPFTQPKRVSLTCLEEIKSYLVSHSKSVINVESCTDITSIQKATLKQTDQQTMHTMKVVHQVTVNVLPFTCESHQQLLGSPQFTTICLATSYSITGGKMDIKLALQVTVVVASPQVI